MPLTDRNRFARIPPDIYEDKFDSRNQFYNKIITVHEGEHLDQWNNQAPWKNLYDADALWEEIEDMTVKGERTAVVADLRQRIDALITRTVGIDSQFATRSSDCRERKAHSLSNNISPDFLNVDLDCAYQSPNYDCDE